MGVSGYLSVVIFAYGDRKIYIHERSENHSRSGQVPFGDKVGESHRVVNFVPSKYPSFTRSFTRPQFPGKLKAILLPMKYYRASLPKLSPILRYPDYFHLSSSWV